MGERVEGIKSRNSDREAKGDKVRGESGINETSEVVDRLEAEEIYIRVSGAQVISYLSMCLQGGIG